jgi:hypothetical protein
VIASLRGAPVETVAAPLPIALAPPAVEPSAWPAVGWLGLAAAWAAGAAIVFARALRAMRAAVRAAKVAPDAPADARALLAELAVRARVRPPRLVVGDGAVGPHVVGVFGPIIVVPPALLGDAMLLRAALLHELAHVRRKDTFGRLVQLWAGSIFFFYPVVRVIGRRLDLAREAACDAWAVEAGELPRPAYARLLVRMATLRAAAAPSLAMSHALDARVEAVLGPEIRSRFGILHGVVLAAWIVLALGGARNAHAERREVCAFTPQLGEALRLAHPEADLDGDGYVSRQEACEFQAELRRRLEASELVSVLEDPIAEEELQSFLEEPLCCNCSRADATTPPTCQPDEGVDP